MAPEIINEKDYDEKSDIWSLGCVMYELAALKPPFDAANAVSLAVKINKGSFQRIPSKYSDHLHDVIRRMLQVDPKRRPRIEDLELSNGGMQSELPFAKLILSEYRMQQSYASKCRDVKTKEDELVQREGAVSKREEVVKEREQQCKSWEDSLQAIKSNKKNDEAYQGKHSKAHTAGSKHHAHRNSCVEMTIAVEEVDPDQLAYFDDYAPVSDRLVNPAVTAAVGGVSSQPTSIAYTTTSAPNTYPNSSTIASMHPAYNQNTRPFCPQPPAVPAKIFSSAFAIANGNSGKIPPPPLPVTQTVTTKLGMDRVTDGLRKNKDHNNNNNNNNNNINTTTNNNNNINNTTTNNNINIINNNNIHTVDGAPKRGPVPLPTAGGANRARPGFYIYTDDSSTNPSNAANAHGTNTSVASLVPVRSAPPIPTTRKDYEITTGAAYDQENIQNTLKVGGGGKVGGVGGQGGGVGTQRYNPLSAGTLNKHKYDAHSMAVKRGLGLAENTHNYHNMHHGANGGVSVSKDHVTMTEGSPFKRQKYY